MPFVYNKLAKDEISKNNLDKIMKENKRTWFYR